MILMALLIITTNLAHQDIASPCDHQQSLLNMASNQPLIFVPKPNATFQAKGSEERRDDPTS